MQRRDFLRNVGTLGLLSYIAPQDAYAALFSKEKTLKGFNLLNKFNPDFQTPFSEKDFEMQQTNVFPQRKIIVAIKRKREYIR